MDESFNIKDFEDPDLIPKTLLKVEKMFQEMDRYYRYAQHECFFCGGVFPVDCNIVILDAPVCICGDCFERYK